MSIGEIEKENAHFNSIMESILENINLYTIDKRVTDKKVIKLAAQYNAGDVELYNDLIISLNTQENISDALKKNNRSKEKPYFGKVCVAFLAEKDKSPRDFYIGKNGIGDYHTREQLVVDWRAPIANVYYNSGMGECTYLAPEGDVAVDVSLKRTFDIENGKLNGFYDSEEITNDELLQKYLSKNKDVVLKDIVSSIQAEQNAIIRQEPWKNVIVQGVAGSGKTTVAMHRISYLLYTFKESLKAEQFYIIAANQLFLNYITGMLPELDVKNVNQFTMKDFFEECIRYVDSGFSCGELLPDDDAGFYSGRMIDGLNAAFEKIEEEIFSFGSEVDPRTVLPQGEIESYLKNFSSMDLFAKAEILDNRIVFVLKNKFATVMGGLSDDGKKLVGRYKNYFKSKVKKLRYREIHRDVQEKVFGELGVTRRKRGLTLSDLASLLFILKTIKSPKELDGVGQVVIDEAQDFNLLTYYCLVGSLRKARFTIVGDIMQNIGRGGTEHWEELRSRVFGDKASVYTLAKSYRNTIQITNFANRIIKRYLNPDYLVQPVIRNGRDVEIYKIENRPKRVSALLELLESLQKNEYKLVSVICRDEADCKKLLSDVGRRAELLLLNKDLDLLQFGVYLGTVENNKGLEFDAVVIWDAEKFNLSEKQDAKLFYVASTRALHELHVYTGLAGPAAFDMLEE